MKVSQLIIFGLCFNLGLLFSQETIIVPDDYSTIQMALDSASARDIILVAPGIYHENIRWPRRRNLTLKSMEGSGQTIIDGANNGRVIEIEELDETSILDGFTIQNGIHDDGGAGIFATQSSMNFKNLVIQDNRGIGSDVDGAGMWLLSCSGRLDSCQFFNNTIDASTTGSGAGLHIRLNNDIVIDGCTFDRNECEAGETSQGGAMFLYFHGVNFVGLPPLVIIRNSTITNNSISGGHESGGGFKLWSFGTPTEVRIDSSTFSNNKCTGAISYGGGLHTYDHVDLILTNSVINENSAGSGAGMYLNGHVENGTLDMLNCIVRKNNPSNNLTSAAIELYRKIDCSLNNCEISHNTGGAFTSENLSSHSTVNLFNSTIAFNQRPLHIRKTTLSVNNSILWNNNSSEVMQHSFDNDNDIIITNSLVNGGFSGTNILSSDPLFTSDEELIPTQESPCINAGTERINRSTDLLGNPRPLPVGTRQDLGCYEVDQELISSTKESDTLVDISIYPNPTSDYLYVSEIVDQVQLYDIKGQLVKVTQQTSQVPLKDLSSGNYIVKIMNDGQSRSESLIINR